jgi:hypothetical protein
MNTLKVSSDRLNSNHGTAPVELFVSGRVCLFGEHSDWAGGFRKTNPDIPCGHTIVVGTSSEGLYARARPHASSLLLVRLPCPYNIYVGSQDIRTVNLRLSLITGVVSP